MQLKIARADFRPGSATGRQCPWAVAFDLCDLLRNLALNAGGRLKTIPQLRFKRGGTPSFKGLIVERRRSTRAGLHQRLGRLLHRGATRDVFCHIRAEPGRCALITPHQHGAGDIAGFTRLARHIPGKALDVLAANVGERQRLGGASSGVQEIERLLRGRATRRGVGIDPAEDRLHGAVLQALREVSRQVTAERRDAPRDALG